MCNINQIAELLLVKHGYDCLPHFKFAAFLNIYALLNGVVSIFSFLFVLNCSLCKIVMLNN